MDLKEFCFPAKEEKEPHPGLSAGATTVKNFHIHRTGAGLSIS